MKKSDSETTQLSRPARKRNPEESKRRILDAAERAFSKRGYDGARLRDVAQEAGVHHALVHHYYGDKRGLFNEVVVRGLGRISSAGLESLADAKGLEESVTRFVGVLYESFARNRDLVRIIDHAFRDRDSIAYEVSQESLGRQAPPLLQTLARRLREGQDAGTVRKDVMVEHLILMGFSVIVYRFIAAREFMNALGVTMPEDNLEEDKQQVALYILGALSAR